MQTEHDYYKLNETINEIKIAKNRICDYCDGTLIFYDSQDGFDLYMCADCNAQDIIENGEIKFIQLFEEGDNCKED